MIDLCRKNEIILFCLPPHTTHTLQPLDVAVFKSLKDNYSKTVRSLTIAKQSFLVMKGEFSKVICEPFERAFFYNKHQNRIFKVWEFTHLPLVLLKLLRCCHLHHMALLTTLAHLHQSRVPHFPLHKCLSVERVAGFDTCAPHIKFVRVFQLRASLLYLPVLTAIIGCVICILSPSGTVIFFGAYKC